MNEKDRVAIETVAVGRVGDRDLKADLYRPPVPNGCGVLLVHGGGWIRGDRSQLRGYGILLGRLGYTCLACEYRLAPEAKWPAQIDDVHTTLRYLHDHALDLGVDREKIAVSGNSAGGHLTLMAAGLGELPVAAAIAFYAPTNFLGDDARSRGAPESMAFLVGDDVSEAKMASISPVTYVSAAFPPTMLIAGNRDELVSWRESETMHLRLGEAGVPTELHVFDGVPHAFDARRDFGRQCAGLMALFLEHHVRNPASVAANAAAE